MGPPPASDGRGFHTTRWTIVLATRDAGTSEAQQALAYLCTTYWHPVYAFIRRSGNPADQARDLTQEFFARVLEKRVFAEADPERGRFRSFLLSSVKHFLANERDKALAQKRGGGATHLPLEFNSGEQRFLEEPSGNLTPELLYERTWALEVVAIAMHRLAARHAERDKAALFDALKPHLTDGDPVSCADVAAQLGMTEGAVRVAIHRLRRRFVAELRGVISDTVHAGADIDDELRHLIETLRQ